MRAALWSLQRNCETSGAGTQLTQPEITLQCGQFCSTSNVTSHTRVTTDQVVHSRPGIYLDCSSTFRNIASACLCNSNSSLRNSATPLFSQPLEILARVTCSSFFLSFYNMPFEIVQVSRDDESIHTFVERYKEFRLLSLKVAPEAFGSTLERERAFTDETWYDRLANPKAVTFLALQGGRVIGSLTTVGPLPFGPDEYVLLPVIISRCSLTFLYFDAFVPHRF